MQAQGLPPGDVADILQREVSLKPGVSLSPGAVIQALQKLHESCHSLKVAKTWLMIGNSQYLFRGKFMMR